MISTEIYFSGKRKTGEVCVLCSQPPVNKRTVSKTKFVVYCRYSDNTSLAKIKSVKKYDIADYGTAENLAKQPWFAREVIEAAKELGLDAKTVRNIEIKTGNGDKKPMVIALW